MWTELLRRIRFAARLGAVNLTRHALQRATARGVSDADIEHALRRATEIGADPDHPGRYRVVGPDLEGEEMELVIKLTNDDWVLVITCGMEPRR